VLVVALGFLVETLARNFANEIGMAPRLPLSSA